jgi:hypothetical protein
VRPASSEIAGYDQMIGLDGLMVAKNLRAKPAA